MDKHYLGWDIPKLGFGLMRPPFISPDGDIKKMQEMVDAFMDAGFSYFDTSYIYGNGISESNVKKLLTERYPRTAFQFATKLPMWAVEKAEDMEHCLNASLTRTGLEYTDFYMLHGLSAAKSDRFPGSYLNKATELDAWGFLRRAKEAGKVNHIGFSYHDSAELLDQLLREHPEVEFVQLQINYADWEDDKIQSRKCYEVARKHNVPVIIMEPLKGRTLLNLRPEIEAIFKEANPTASLASWAIRYGASLDGIITVLSGMQSIDIVKENVSYMQDFTPLSESEYAVIEKAAAALLEIDTIKCTGCRYCLDDCPMNIPIPAIFEHVNDYRIYGDLNYSKRRYNNATEGTGKASDCIQCGSCEAHCPQKIDIIQHLKTAATLFEVL
ncbi:aldo/keto reductase [Eubacteriales bacterium OttesenSCG-928-M02]|nr:aldo/keto reductase [Eubacteriales bacterium OttesenSCG-928-M02]